MNIQSLVDEVPVEGEYTLEGVDFITSGEQYLTFLLDTEQYGVDILCVEEIRGWEKPTLIPNAPSYVKGVINMRGIIVPIVDLRQKFNIGTPKYTEETVVIVLRVETPDFTRTVGYVVDAVSDVLNADESEIKPAPPFGGRLPQHYISGLVNSGASVVTLLDLNVLQTIESHPSV